MKRAVGMIAGGAKPGQMFLENADVFLADEVIDGLGDGASRSSAFGRFLFLVNNFGIEHGGSKTELTEKRKLRLR